MADFIRIATFYDPEEAHIALGFLKSHGVDAALSDNATLSVLPGLRVALGGYRMLAPEAQAEEAKALLAEIRQSESARGVEHDGLRCNQCGGARFSREKSWFLPSAITLLFGAPFSWNTGRVRCADCGASTKYNENTDEQ